MFHVSVPWDIRAMLDHIISVLMSSFVSFSGQINSQERKIQEAMFEMITSEASYLKSLNVLVTHFVQCPDFIDEGEDAVLSRRERHILFSDILPGEMFRTDSFVFFFSSSKLSVI